MNLETYMHAIEWDATGRIPILKMGETHLWRIDLKKHEEDVDIYRDFLSSQELKRAERFKHRQGERNFTITRGVLRWLLSQYTGILINRIKLRFSEHGKPFLPSVHFNIAHSSDYALLAFSRQNPVGVDVELVKDKRDFMRIAKHYFNPAELEEIESFQSADIARQCFFAIWTRKEAYIKALGTGLFSELGSFGIPLGSTHVTGKGDGYIWQIHTFTPARNYFGSICIRKPAKQLSAHDWTSTFCKL